MEDLQNLQPGEYTLPGKGLLPDQGTPKANWKQNSSVLRKEMRENVPIRDASGPDNAPSIKGDPSSKPIRNTFTGAERNLLRNHNWIFDEKTNFWNPPSLQ